MAGYNNFSKSNNAVLAENEGKLTLTQAAKTLKCSTAAIKSLLQPCEWHHTSKMYNRTNYYDISELEPNEIDELRNFKVADKNTKIIENGRIEYLTWGGTRKRPTANEEVFAGTFEIKGEWLIFDNKRKNINSNGTKAFDSKGKRIFE